MAGWDALARKFSSAPEFTPSPLYTALGQTVAGDPFLLGLAARIRAGQYPTFLFFGSVQYLLLGGVDHELAQFYPSIVGTDARPPAAAGPALVDFAHTYAEPLTDLLTTRLVQTNHVQRSLALRLGLSVVHRQVTDPVHVIEVGTSAGLNLRFERYGYQLGEQHLGPVDSPVQVESGWRGPVPMPDLTGLPTIASVTGIDLHPLDIADPDDRRWLHALVWPENRHQAALLEAAFTIALDEPLAVRGGDAVDLCPALAAELPPGETRVLFHAATRMHVPTDRLAAFDAALASLGRNAPLYHLSLEPTTEPGWTGLPLTLRHPDGRVEELADADGHLHWVNPRSL